MDVSAAKKILYITYDGLTDPLGQSQILPYLKGLSAHGYQFTILSFEKKARFQKEKAVIDQLVSESNIEWVPLSFTSKPPLLSKLHDALQMRRKAVALHKEKRFDMVHCRSYVAADAGLALKKRFGIKFFFDMRGFWVDEKKDGTWNMANPIFQVVYRYYKKKEAQYLEHADFIVSLTHAGKREMATWTVFNRNVPLQVIPCCADTQLFSATSNDQKQQSREQLHIRKDQLVVSYLGSVGAWYMLDEMVQFFARVKKHYRDALFLFVTHSNHHLVQNKFTQHGLSLDDLLIMEVPRKAVPDIIKASDVNISFIKPVYSKIASSPTKLGEVLSMGIPVICNCGVGDVAEIVKKAEAGYVMNDFTNEEYENAIESIPHLMKKDPATIRNAAESVFSLSNGIQSYLSCYRQILQ